MATLLAMVVGAAFGTGLLGALIAWLLRKITPISLVISYLIGVAVAVVVATFVYSSQVSDMPLGTIFGVYLVGGVIGFLVLVATSRKAH